MNIVVIVNDSPNRSQAAATALRFCQAAVRTGHRISQVFFYADGVYQCLPSEAADEADGGLYRHWIEFGKDQQVPLGACSAAVKRRLPAGAGQTEIPSIGLARFAETALAADRLVSFGSLQ